MNADNRTLIIIIGVVLVINIAMLAAVLNGINTAQEFVTEAKSVSNSNHTLLCANYELRLKQDPLVQTDPDFLATFNKECQ